MSVVFGVLGEIEAECGGAAVDLGSPQQRALFGVLVMARGRVVSTDHLIEQMWGPGIDSTAERKLRSTVRTYVLRLRRAFADVGLTSSVIETVSNGYRLVVPGVVDLAVFSDEVALGRAARSSGDLAGASDHFRAALGQWRGVPLSGARAFFVDEERSRLQQRRIAVLEDRIELDLALRRGVALEGELAELVTRYPLRERFHEYLMLTLYRTGRQAESLQVYQQVRRTLDRELGVLPGPGLADMQQRILRGDPMLLPEPGVWSESPSEMAPVAVHQLPADTPDFTGRDELVTRLVGRLTGEDGPVRVGLSGLDGIGKTTVALRVAHLVRDHYPDGQLYADLGARDGLCRVGEVLGRFLRALGIAGPLPDEVVERADLWRSGLAGRRVLVVVDDAAGADQLRLLLPATSGSAAIVTAVRRLDVTALRWESVGALPESETVTLFERIVGAGQCAPERQLHPQLVEIAAGYPQFVRMAGQLVLDRPYWSFPDVLARLREDTDAPNPGHPDYRRISGAIERSLALVDREVATAFRFVGVAQVASVTPESVAALLGTRRARALAILDELADVHLLERDRAGTFTMLTPVRAYAREIARQSETPESLHAALARMRLFYKESEGNARVAGEARRGIACTVHQTHIHGGVHFTDQVSAKRWLSDNGVDLRMLTEQLLRYSPAHAPVLVSHIRALMRDTRRASAVDLNADSVAV